MRTQGFIGRTSAWKIDIPLGAASVSLNVLSLLMPISILLIFDRVIPFQSAETLRMLTLALLISTAMELILRWTRSVLLNVSAEEAAISNHHRFMSRVLQANTVDFAKDPGSSYIERYAAIGQLRDHHAGQNQTLAIDLPFTLLFALMIGLIGGGLVLVPVGAFCVALMFTFFMKRAQWALFGARKKLDTRRYAFLSELLSNMSTIKANRMERQMARRFEMLEDQTVDISRKLIQFSGLAQSFGAVFSQLTVASMGLLGAYLVITDMIGIAELAACMLLNGRIIQPLTKLMTLWVQSESLAVSRARLDEMEALETQSETLPDAQILRGDILVQGLSMKRRDRTGRSFANASFHVPQGSTVLVNARDAWMIRAFFSALAGQRKPDRGEILIGDIPASQLTAWRGKDAMVILESDPAILSGTLLENLSAFGGVAQIERAKHFAAALGLEERIHRLPKGYNTKLNTGTSFERDPVNRQLIALTRALAVQPRVLLMNEPSAILDTPERHALATCLRSLSPRPTILMASPDPRLKHLADDTVMLEAETAAEIAAWDADAEQERLDANTQRKGAA
ncbi:RTX-I toxin determinant B [Phaeobacter sp. CECT 5382]|uniref:ABC transporter transmembrane domain-containing protein n=1 Tax=Phaeobacter sp. CECT 5382 TaxID=1712645 RepID=UPI0006DB4775|nr:ABC transporter transmembrane domain-containing protein [Phaeobacter sp. CECT 5382]CUH89596.1 RTX-I toxin determinant B [Phaeobacter sp. CECT 5382]